MVNRVLTFLVFTFLLYSTTIHAATFKGKVIDANTKEPIEGAVVVVSWGEETATITGPSGRSKDIKETLVDKNGEWKIRGPKGGGIAKILLLIPGMYYTTPPEFIVFKPGYCSYPAGFGIKACKETMKVYNFTNSDNIGEVVELPRLKDRDRETMLRNIPFIAADDMRELPIYEKLLGQDMKGK